MQKTFVGPRLRQLRRSQKQTQAEMAKIVGVSPAYINLLENNQRSLSVQVLMALTDAYNIDWRDLVKDEGPHKLSELRNVLQDPIFGETLPDLQELRAAVDHAPKLVDDFLKIYRTHRITLDTVMRDGGERFSDTMLDSSPEGIIHDVFRKHSNHFAEIEAAAETTRSTWTGTPDDHYGALKARLKALHGIDVVVRPIDELLEVLRFFDRDGGRVILSQALDHPNRVFQLAHIICLLEHDDLLSKLIDESDAEKAQAKARLRVEFANYFAAALLMPYEAFLREAESVMYDLDRLAATFGTSFEQVCQRLTTLQREGAHGVPFFFLRVDKAGNVTKRFNATSFDLAEYGGSCPVWNIHTAFYQPGVIMPQFVEMPGGDQFFTFSRTVHRPVYNQETQDRRLTLAMGCEFRHAEKIGYTAKFNFDDPGLFDPIGINCQLCPRQACSQRAHQPILIDLPIDTDRRGSTRYES